MKYEINDEVEGPSGRKYVLIGRQPYRRPSGELSEVLTWRSSCRKCGAEFTCKGGPTAHGMAVHCERHRMSREERTRHWLASTRTPEAIAKREATKKARRELKRLL